MLLDLKVEDFRFWASGFLRGISGNIARKKCDVQVLRDSLSGHQVFFRHTLIQNFSSV